MRSRPVTGSVLWGPVDQGKVLVADGAGALGVRPDVEAHLKAGTKDNNGFTFPLEMPVAVVHFS